MKTKVLLYCVGLFIILTNCETSTFQYVMSSSRSLDYTVDHTGRFTENNEIAASELNADLELPEDAIVRGVYIEALSISTETLSENEADEIILDGWIIADETVQFLEGFVIPIEPGESDFIKLGNLVANGILSISENLESFILEGVPSSVGFRLEGNSYPETGENIHLNISIDITMSVTYELESEVPWFIQGS